MAAGQRLRRLFTVETVVADWWRSEDMPYKRETLELAVGRVGIVGLELIDWAWSRDPPGPLNAGVLHLAGYGDRGSVSALAVSIETHHVPGVPGYDRIVLPEGAVAEPQRGILRAHSHPLRFDIVGSAYALQRTSGEDGNDLAVTRYADGDQVDSVALPAGLLSADQDVWMTARGDDVFLGDGTGRAWWLPWTRDGWARLREIDGDIRYAVPLGLRYGEQDGVPFLEPAY